MANPHPLPTAARPSAPPSPAPSDAYVQSFARGLEVICTFSAHTPAQTLSEVASASGLTRAGARRILLTLQSLGYVRSDGKQFNLTAKILDLGFAYLSSMPIWDLAEPVMQGLVDAVQESCSAAVLDGDDIVYVLRVPTQKIMRISLGVGSRLPAYCTSMGRLLLSTWPPEQLAEWLHTTQRNAYTRHTLVDAAALSACIDQARVQGWCLVNQELEEGLISIAAPLTNAAGEMVAALNISGQANRTSAQEMHDTMLAPLLSAARSISHLMQVQRR